MSSEQEVQSASKQFYSALNQLMKGNVGPMAEVWSHSADVSAMHPAGPRADGWDNVKGSWAMLAGVAQGGEVSLNDQRIMVSGELACEVGVEKGKANLAGHPLVFDHRVTNVYRREGGKWKLAHHHADRSEAMEEVAAKLQSAG